MLPSLPTVMGQINGGRLRALTVTTAKRSAALPKVAAIAEPSPCDLAAFDRDHPPPPPGDGCTSPASEVTACPVA